VTCAGLAVFVNAVVGIGIGDSLVLGKGTGFEMGGGVGETTECVLGGEEI
jgi:hypothetical protein